MIQSCPGYLAERSGGLLTITFNLPEQGNPIPAEAVLPLTACFEAAQNDSGIRCILLRGTGRHFSTGGNVSNFFQEIAHGPDHLAASFEARLARTGRLVESVVDFDRPIIAVIRGGVAGAGLLFALAADVVLADETATFVFAHQRIGLTPDAGVSFLLPRAVGLREAKHIVLTAAKLDAREAARLGLIHRLVAGDELDAQADEQALQFCRAPQYAVRRAKCLLADSLPSTLADQLAAETSAIVACVQDKDFVEGVTAFTEKRPARFPSAEPSRSDD